MGPWFSRISGPPPPKKKFTPRHSSPISLSRTPKIVRADFLRDGPKTTTTIIFQKSCASATPKRHLMAHEMTNLFGFSVFHCAEGAFGASSGGAPKMQNGAPRDELKSGCGSGWAVAYSLLTGEIKHFQAFILWAPENWRVSNAALANAALVLSLKNWKIYSRWGAASDRKSKKPWVCVFTLLPCRNRCRFSESGFLFRGFTHSRK